MPEKEFLLLIGYIYFVQATILKISLSVFCALPLAALAQGGADTTVLDRFGFRLFDVSPCKCPPGGYKIDPTMEHVSPYPWDNGPLPMDSTGNAPWILKEEEPLVQ